MPSKSVNITLSTPVGPLEIYVDKREQARAERLIAKTPSILTEGYAKGTEKFGNQLLRIVRRSLNTGVPPRGSGVSWPPHAPGTLKKYGDHTMLNLTGTPRTGRERRQRRRLCCRSGRLHRHGQLSGRDEVRL